MTRLEKSNLVNYGFRLQAAVDNRPLKFEEFESLTNQVIYVSATPADYELEKSEGVVTEQIIRPTGLLDPLITVRPSLGQIDDLINEIDMRVKKNERTLVTTLTKRMAEELTEFLLDHDLRVAYIHSGVDTMDRIKILDQLRSGEIDVLVGVNLLREGLDLPEVSLVAIIDADKEGFLRSNRSLTQTAGRAARNLNGEVIMYADKITQSMQQTIDETERRRSLQLAYNAEHGITPKAIIKQRNSIIGVDNEFANASPNATHGSLPKRNYPATSGIDAEFNPSAGIAADPVVQYMNEADLGKTIELIRKNMIEAAKNMDFIEAARLRDELLKLEERKESMK